MEKSSLRNSVGATTTYSSLVTINPDGILATEHVKAIKDSDKIRYDLARSLIDIMVMLGPLKPQLTLICHAPTEEGSAVSIFLQPTRITLLQTPFNVLKAIGCTERIWLVPTCDSILKSSPLLPAPTIFDAIAWCWFHTSMEGVPTFSCSNFLKLKGWQLPTGYLVNRYGWLTRLTGWMKVMVTNSVIG